MDAETKARKILLINLHSSWNAGDDALAQEALRQLQVAFPHASFTLAMNDPDSYRGEGKAIGSFTAWVKPITDEAGSRWRWAAFPGLLGQSLLALIGFRLTGRPWFLGLSQERQTLLRAYVEADLVISSAGNFLYSSGRVGLPFLMALFAMLFAWWAGKPLYALPQTLGPIRRRWESWLVRHVLSRMRLVLVRDSISADLWRRWDIKGPQWALVPDLAFALSPGEGREEVIALLAEYGIQGDRYRPWLGATLIQWGAQHRWFLRQAAYEEAIAAAIRAFLTSYGGRVALFAQVFGPTQVEDDRVPARRVLAKLGDLADQAVLVDRWLPPHVLKAAYAHMDLFIGTRLHSNIFALAEGVPVIAIGYQYKTRGVLRMLGLERWTLDIDQVSEESLVRLLHSAWAERELTHAHIQETMSAMRNQAMRVGELIASDFFQLESATQEYE